MDFNRCFLIKLLSGFYIQPFIDQPNYKSKMQGLFFLVCTRWIFFKKNFRPMFIN